jgi:hypothetical protein
MKPTYWVLASLLLSAACISTNPDGQQVRLTTNSEAVHGCTFLGNVKATSGWGGLAMQGVAANNTEVALREKTAKLGGNVVFVVSSGIHASGEAYRCSQPGEQR